MCRDRNELGVTAPLLGNHLFRGQLVFHALWVSRLFVDLVDRYHDWHFRRSCVLNRLLGLRHDAVIRCDDQHHDIG